MSDIALPRTRTLLTRAVHQNPALSRAGLYERLFTFAFSGLVYAQIWEDPVIDMEALAITPDCDMLVIASGGCNALSYLTANPASITAVDLNAAHVALNRLKQAAFRAGLTDDEIDALLVRGQGGDITAIYEQKLAPMLDGESRSYWEGRPTFRRRIDLMARGLYRMGLLGRFIALAHALARRLGVDLAVLAQAKSPAEQRALFARHVAPAFERTLMRKLLDHPAALYGLGIPPQQYHALCEGRPMAVVVRERLEKLLCDFPLEQNYFAWQALARGYEPREGASLPPYLMAGNRASVRERIDRLHTKHCSLNEELARRAPHSLDRYVLLDAQDWMDNAALTALWREITRTARPGARVIFRTAGRESILTGRVPQAILSQWHYHAEASRDFTRRDRSAIYGGVHLYELSDEA